MKVIERTTAVTQYFLGKSNPKLKINNLKKCLLHLSGSRNNLLNIKVNYFNV